MSVSQLLRDLADKIDQGKISGGSSVLIIDGETYIAAMPGYNLSLVAYDLGEALAQVNQLINERSGCDKGCF